VVRLSPEMRSKIMTSIRSRGNASTELRFIEILRSARVRGWRRHQELPGRPDFAFRAQRTAVFIDGCFWHCCPRCSKPPKKNRSYWAPKLQRNCERDKEVSTQLRKAGWTVLRIWEHQLDKPIMILRRLERALAKRSNAKSQAPLS
jgi:DNA mismatch endonuclease (patch repair protein)